MDQTQFSALTLGIRSNSRILLVTTIIWKRDRLGQPDRLAAIAGEHG
jgi:hypothetical protein